MSIVRVAVGVIINKDNQVLIAKRASYQHQGDKWEFPGGKVENTESSDEALVRELKEEVGIEAQAVEFMLEIIHQYDDKKVQLDVYKVEKWMGEATGKEGQDILWVDISQLEKYKFPDANIKIISQLNA